MKLRSIQNASIEIMQISFVYQQNRFTVEKLIYKVQNENSFTNKRFLLTLKRNLNLLKLTFNKIRKFFSVGKKTRIIIGCFPNMIE